MNLCASTRRFHSLILFSCFSWCFIHVHIGYYLFVSFFLITFHQVFCSEDRFGHRQSFRYLIPILWRPERAFRITLLRHPFPMATPPVRQWGVTPPISTVLPTKDEISANDDLISELKAQNNFEQPTETEQRCVGGFLGEEVNNGWSPEIDKKYSSYYSALLSNSSKSSVVRRVFLQLRLKLLVVKSLHMEVIGLVSTDPVGDPS